VAVQRLAASTIFLIALFNSPQPVYGVEFSARVVDGAGNPVAGAWLTASCFDSRRDGTYGRAREVFRLESDEHGIISGSYKPLKAACKKSFEVAVQKWNSMPTGFDGYNALRSVYVIKRIVRAGELDEIVRLNRNSLAEVLRNSVTAEKLRQGIEVNRNDLTVSLRSLIGNFFDGPTQILAFYYEDRVRPSLRSLVQDTEVGMQARRLLAFIGLPEDLHLIVELGLLKDQNPASPYLWLNDVVSSLLEPTSEAEWNLLRESALGGYKEPTLTRGAIRTLKLIGSTRSREILEEVERKNPFAAGQAASAIQYIESNPQPIRDERLDELTRRVVQMLGISGATGEQTPEYNEDRDKAFSRFSFDVGQDVYFFIGRFQQVDGVWLLRGIREAGQAYAGPPSAVLKLKTK
jgi:hypothetical protein